MGDQLFGIVVVLLALVGAVVAATYVFALTAEREPEVKRNPTVKRQPTSTSAR